MKTDRILIQGLDLAVRIGITETERANSQRLKLDLEIEPRVAFADLEEDICRTVDYFAVCQTLEEFAAGREWNLIETLCHECAQLVLRDFAVESVTVTVRKFILPQTECVAARTQGRRGEGNAAVENL